MTMTSVIANWPTGPVRLSWLACVACEFPVTSVHGFCFAEGKVLVCRIRGRGWSIPGGHVEEGETLYGCLTRELREEADAGIRRANLIGFIVADHSVNETYVGRYPIKSALVVFSVILGKLTAYAPSDAALWRQLVELDALPKLHHQWDPVLDAAYREARRQIPA
jgi:8-oxo-dGTP diphosphatase